MSEEVKVLSESEKKKEDWMNSKWRPMMGWMYMLVCMCDFIIFPVLWSLLHAVLHTANMTQWNPLTRQGAGLFHIAMGAVLGIAAFGRTQEKLGGANNGGIQTPGTGFAGGSSTFSQPQSGGFGSQSSSFGSTPLGGNSASGFSATSRAPSTFGAASAGAAGGFAVASTMPMVGKPANIGPVDDDYMPPRE